MGMIIYNEMPLKYFDVWIKLLMETSLIISAFVY